MAKKNKKSSNERQLRFLKINCGPLQIAMRGSMDAAEYKHVALGLIFLKYIFRRF